MARTIEEIKGQMLTAYTGNETVRAAYGVAAGEPLAFSKVSVENLLFYAVSVCVYTLERLFDEHSAAVDATVEAIRPHRPKWYAQKALSFMQDCTLKPDTDVYDTSGMSEAAVEAAKVVKHAVATESANASLLTIKVAGGTAGGRAPLPAAAETQLLAYLREIKDAGVCISLVNDAANAFNCRVDVYYDPQKLPETVQQDCMAAVKDYIENLPFDGEYSNMALVDALQAVGGVEVVELKSAAYMQDGATIAIDAACTPPAGYFGIGTVVINMVVHE